MTLSEHQTSLSDAESTFNEVQPVVNIPDGDPLHTLLKTVVRELQRVDMDIDTLFDDRFLDTATGKELERLGATVDIDRKTGESDDKLRKRIRANYAAAASRGTYEDIARVALIVLETDPSKVTLKRSQNTSDPATAIVEVESQVVDNSPFTNSEIADILSQSAIGGHRVFVNETNVFTWDDSNLGWGTDWGGAVGSN